MNNSKNNSLLGVDNFFLHFQQDFTLLSKRCKDLTMRKLRQFNIMFLLYHLLSNTGNSLKFRILSIKKLRIK